MVKPLLAYVWSQLERKGYRRDTKLTADDFLKLATAEMDQDCPALVRALVSAIQGNPDRLTVFRQFYSRPAPPPMDLSLRRVRRASRIFGDMLRGLDGGQGIPTKLGGWVAQAGAVGTRFVEFSMPGTMLHVLRRHWLQLLYLAEAMLIGIGAVGIYPQPETAGWITLCVTAIIHLVSWVIGRVIGSRRWKLQVALVSLAVFAVSVGGAAFVSATYHLPWEVWKTPLHTVLRLLTHSRVK